MRIERRSGQAMAELIVGIFALALVVSALCFFTAYVTASLSVQNSVRNPSARTDGFRNGDRLEVGDFAAAWFVGRPSLRVKEEVKMPATVILQ